MRLEYTRKELAKGVQNMKKPGKYTNSKDIESLAKILKNKK